MRLKIQAGLKALKVRNFRVGCLVSLNPNRVTGIPKSELDRWIRVNSFDGRKAVLAKTLFGKLAWDIFYLRLKDEVYAPET